MSKQNLKIFSKVKGFTKDQLRDYLTVLRDVSVNVPEEYFDQILSMKKTEQLRAIKDIILSLNAGIAKESFQTYESNLAETSVAIEIPHYYRVNDIDILRGLLNSTQTKIQSYDAEQIVVNGLKAFLKYHTHQFPEYMINDVLTSVFSMNLDSSDQINDDTKYIHELLGLDQLKESIIIFYGQMELNLRLLIVTGFLMWEEFEQKIIEHFKTNNEFLFLPEEDIGTFELEIYKTLVLILEKKILKIKNHLNVFSLIEKIYAIIRNSSLTIEPWREYLYG